MSRPVVGDSFLEDWRDDPLTSARDIAERQHGAVYGAWHDNPVRVWERDLRALTDGDFYYLNCANVKRISICTYEIYDTRWALLRRVRSTTHRLAIRAVVAALQELEGARAA